MEDNFRIVGKLTHCIFKNEETGFAIWIVHVKIHDAKATEFLKNDKITISGYNFPECKTILYDMKIKGIEDNRYGKQGSLLSIQDYENQEEDAIIRYLTHGPIDGIGITIAKRIYAAFGKDTIHILNETPEKLLEIQGIKEKKFEKILESKKEHSEVSELMELLMPYGFTDQQCVRINKRFKTLSVELVKTDPFRIVNEVSRISFTKMDSYVRKMKMDLTTPSRIQAGIMEAFINAELNGHVALDNNYMLNEIYSVLGEPRIPREQILEVANDLSRRKLLRASSLSGKTLIYRERAYLAEWTIAKKAVDLSMQTKSFPEEKINQFIKETEEEKKITFSEKQRMAAKQAVWNNFLILTGGPGTGKTCTELLIVSVLRKVYQYEHREIEFCMLSPTGRAAKEMEKSTQLPAYTIDSKLELREDYASNVIIEEDVTLVDETSMLDLYKAAALFEAIMDNHKLIMIGDIDQLPSIGAGQVLHELIDGGAPIIRLDRIYRQQGSEGELIISNAAKINTGKTDLTFGDGFQFYEDANDTSISEKVNNLYMSCVKKYGIEETICLLPTKNTPLVGVYDMNKKLQQNMDLADENVKVFNQTFHIGDIVLNTQNKKEKGIVNGDVGFVTNISEEGSPKAINVKFDRTTVLFKGTELTDLILAYSMTIHKSQGSGYQAVIIALSDHVTKQMLQRNLLYTAVTRSKTEVFIVGSKKVLDTCIRTSSSNKRNTSLSAFMRFYYKKNFTSGKIEVKKLA